MATKKDTVVFAGGIFRDLVAFASEFPKPGETVFGQDFLASFGGKAANQSVACANLSGGGNEENECKVAFVGAVGKDENGRAYKEALKERGVDVTGLAEMEGQHTGVACITVRTDTGENQIVVVKGASGAVGAEQVAAADFSRAAMVVCALEMNEEAVLAALRRGKEVGATTVLNAAPAPSAPRSEPHSSILRLSDVICVNETEAETILAGLGDSSARVESIDQAKDSCIALLKHLGKELSPKYSYNAITPCTPCMQL